jgi:hypothetical protein
VIEPDVLPDLLGSTAVRHPFGPCRLRPFEAFERVRVLRVGTRLRTLLT